MMLTDEELNSAIDALFLATKENCDPKSEFFQKLTIDDLPDSDQKLDGVPVYFQKQSYIFNLNKQPDEFIMTSMLDRC